jgi:hypothetical protein
MYPGRELSRPFFLLSRPYMYMYRIFGRWNVRSTLYTAFMQKDIVYFLGFFLCVGM